MLINLKDNLKGARVKDKYNKHGNIERGGFFFLVREILGITLLIWDISRKELQSK